MGWLDLVRAFGELERKKEEARKKGERGGAGGLQADWRGWSKEVKEVKVVMMDDQSKLG